MSRLPIPAVVALVLCGAAPASAINIVTTYNPAGAGAVDPSFDSGATQLDAIFNAVEAYYQDIFEDNGHTVTINFWYTDLADSKLGDHDFVSADINNRENVANIKIDTRVGTGGALRSYFYDSTPTENEEFNMSQTLWRDIGLTNQLDWYNYTNPIPDTFEVGYTGTATGGGAVGKIDMFSLVLHEVGHALGMSGDSPGTQAETGVDSDYDFDPNFVFGAALAADTVDQASDFLGHLDSSNMLMSPSLGSAGTRKLPSHTDLMAMAAGNSYLTLDAPRREFYGGGDWNNAFNWTGSRPPDGNDDAFVRDSQGPGTVVTASLSAGGYAQNLQVSEGANVDVNSYQLTVTDDATVTGLDSDIFINPGGELQSDRAFIQDQAEIEMNGGTLDVNRLVIGASAQLNGVAGGAMTVDVATQLVNDGAIDVDTNAVMTFESTGGAVWDLDGVSGNGQLIADDGDLIFDTGSLADAFGGTMTVGPGYFIRIDASWNVQGGAVLNLDGGSGPGLAAQMTGGTITFNGGTVDAGDAAGDGLTDGVDEFVAPVTVNAGTFNVGVDDTLNFQSLATLNGGDFTLAQGASLNFNNQTIVSGATFYTYSTSIADGDVEFNSYTRWEDTNTVNGLARQDGDASVLNGSPATINAGVFDMDGNIGAGQTWTLSDDLTINADAIDTSGGYDGTLNIYDAFATLTVNTPSPWTLSGTLNVSHAVQSTNTSIAGQDFTLAGTAYIDAWTGFDAKVNLTGDINFVSTGNVLSLRGGNTLDPNTINGGGIYGAGTLSLGSADGLVGNGIITPTGIGLGLNARLLASGGQLTITSASVLASPYGRIGTADSSGTLQFIGAFDTSRVQALELNGGSVAGDKINNFGTTTGHGTIQNDGFDNRNLLSADGGTLILDTLAASPPDLDGTANVGQIQAINGSVQVNNDFAGIQTFNGTLTVGANKTFRMLYDGLLNIGQVTLQGGSYIAPQFRQDGVLDVQPYSLLSSTLDSDSVFDPFSVTHVNADLHLVGNTEIEVSASVSGGGTLINDEGSHLQLKDGSEIGVDLLNEGSLEVGDSPGIASIRASAMFAPTSDYDEELNGTAVGLFDQLQLTESIDLDGTLLISLVGGYAPTVGDVYEMMYASLGVSGAFSSVKLPAVSAAGLSLQYDPNSVRLLALLPGDLNGDGYVGLDDLQIILGAWNQKVTADVWAEGDANGDGYVGLDDLQFILDNWNTGTLPDVKANIPEPSMTLLLGLGGLALLRRTGRGNSPRA